MIRWWIIAALGRTSDGLSALAGLFDHWANSMLPGYGLAHCPLESDSMEPCFCNECGSYC